MTSFLKFVIAACASIILTQCGYVTNNVNGKGKVIKQEYALENFTSIDLQNGWEVELIPAEENKMLITANANLLEELKYDFEENTLRIAAERNIGNADKKLIQIFYSQALQQLSASSGVYLYSTSALEHEHIETVFSSGCKVELSIQSDSFELKASSGANVILNGISETINYSVSSGAGVNALELIGQKVKASASSGASLKLGVEGDLNAKSSSGAVIRYQGQADAIVSSTSSGGSVKKM